MTQHSYALLELRQARAINHPSNDLTGCYDLRLNAGECAFVASAHTDLSTGFVELLLGLRPLSAGAAFCLGLEWARLSGKRADALRGRVGRYTSQGAWIGLYTMDMNILLQQMHHTNAPYGQLVQEAEALCQTFGLPGLPTSKPDIMSSADRRKAGLVRAFLNHPPIIILENPFIDASQQDADLVFQAIAHARLQGSGVVCLNSESHVWSHYTGRGVKVFNLYENGLEPVAGER